MDTIHLHLVRLVGVHLPKLARPASSVRQCLATLDTYVVLRVDGDASRMSGVIGIEEDLQPHTQIMMRNAVVG